MSAVGEFERQLENLIAKRCPDHAGLEPEAFRRRLEALRQVAADLPESDPDFERGRFPFAIVVGRDLFGPEASIGLVERRGRAAATTMLDADDFEQFLPIEPIGLPEGSAYLVVDVSTGSDTLNVTPDDALETIERQGRSPLTLDEGIALVTQFPEAVASNGGFSLPGSRRGDRRVTALWISRGRPKLGWCWAGNPHTWLGSASCGERIGALIAAGRTGGPR
jgi:hypothetical protein